MKAYARDVRIRALEALPPFDARSLGMLQAWRLASAAPALRGAPDARVNGRAR